MKNCKNCKNPFETSILIEGKIHNLQKRRYCLICSPFKQHNTIQIHLKGNKKLCGKCKLILDLSCFSKRGKNLQSYCKSCNTKERNLLLKVTKQKLVDYKGGQCSICGYKKYIGALDFHHLNPKTKDISLSHFTNYSFDKIKFELDKCILVCSNCHREIHGSCIQIPTENSSSED